MSSSSGLPHATLCWQPSERLYLVTVVAKATFVLAPGKLALAEDQEPLNREDGFLDDDPKRSLLSAGELVPGKKQCDVVVVGHAFANDPHGAQTVVARLSIAGIDKRIEVISDRAVGTDGTVYQGGRFTRLPLLYERTAGGPGTWNPVGVRSESRDPFGRSPLPNLVALGAGAQLGATEPVGFGPIAPSWRSRADKLLPGVDPARLFEAPLPTGFDMHYFNVAPADQQVSAIADDARLRLEHLHPLHAELDAWLPGLRANVTVTLRGATERPMMRLDTLVIDTDRSLVTALYRGLFSVEHPADLFSLEASLSAPQESWQTAAGEGPVRSSLAEGAGASPPWVASSRTLAVTADPRLTGAPFLPFKSGAPSGRAHALPFAKPAPSSSGDTGSALPFSKPGSISHAAPPPSAAPVPSQAGRPSLPTVPLLLEQLMPVAPSVLPAPPPFLPPSAPMVAEPYVPPQAPSVAVVAPVAPSFGHASQAALGGLVAASNAAADPQATGTRQRQTVSHFQGDGLQLLWFAEPTAGRLRRKLAWKELVDKIEPPQFDPEIDDPDIAVDPVELENRREIHEVLSHAAPSGPDGIDQALSEAVSSQGRFQPQLLLLSGELRFDFDEKEMLKATVTAVRPFVNDEEEDLRKTVESVTALFANDSLVASPEVLEAATLRVRTAFKNANRPVDASYADEQAERVLLERRAYQRRTVLGEPHLLAHFFFEGTGSGVPTYLPEPLAKLLPLFRALRVKVIAEVHYQADQYESHPAALRLLALARIVRA